MKVVDLGDLVTYYSFSAATLAEADVQMRKLGPKDGDGSHAGSCEAKANPPSGNDLTVAVKVDSSGEAGYVCTASVASARVAYRFVLTFPNWLNVGNLAREAQSEWGRFTRALSLHEQGHKPGILKVVRRFAARLEALKIAGMGPSETAAGEAAKKSLLEQVPMLWEPMKSDVAKAIAAYDLGTRHGRKQGARLKTKPESKAKTRHTR